MGEETRLTPEMIEAGAEEFFDWSQPEFPSCEEAAKAVYLAMERARLSKPPEPA